MIQEDIEQLKDSFYNRGYSQAILDIVEIIQIIDDSHGLSDSSYVARWYDLISKLVEKVCEDNDKIS